MLVRKPLIIEEDTFCESLQTVEELEQIQR